LTKFFENIKWDGKVLIFQQGCNSWNKSAKSQSIKTDWLNNTV
jgi:hypothetical protein